MFTIGKEFSFCASHQLTRLPEGHPCGRLHGHNYLVTVYLSGGLDERGFVLDYSELDTIKKWIDKTLDHRHLNSAMSVPPTAENISKMIYHEAKKYYGALLKAVKVQETPKTFAYYEEVAR